MRFSLKRYVFSNLQTAFEFSVALFSIINKSKRTFLYSYFVEKSKFITCHTEVFRGNKI
jgi:hypothetical protein